MLRELCSLAIGASMLGAVIPAANGQAAAINGEITGVVTDATGGAVANGGRARGHERGDELEAALVRGCA